MSAASDMPAIRIEGLRKAFGAVQALDSLALRVDRGSVFGFLGPNGAGKTTTIRILTGLARASAGRAWVDGVEVTASPRQVGRHIGYLPQDPAFYPWMTGQELLDYVGRVFGLAAQERNARTRELLELVGLTSARKRRVGGYSGGMRQRLELIDRLRGECTVFMSTHILADVERVCDTVGIINRGKLIAEAPQAELLERYATPAFELEVDRALAGPLTAWAERVATLPWVTSAAVDGRSARIVVSEVETAKRELVASAIAADLVLTRYAMVRPSLEDVFLHLVNAEEVTA
jgi:ABC-2 type transport system ATP-binding protein